MSERDTHFKRFAALLYKEIRNDLSNVLVPGLTPQQEQRMKQWIQQLIAQRAFDFAEHIIKHQKGSTLDEMKEGLAHFLEVDYPGYKDMPDMTEWPEEEVM